MALGPSSRKKSFPKVVAHSALAHYRGTAVFMLCAFFLMLVSYTNVGFVQKLRESLLSELVPVFSALTAPITYTADFFGSVSGLAELSALNKALMVENAKLKQWHQVAASLKDENDKLRTLLNAHQDLDKTFITTRIVMDAGSQFVHSFIVPVGAAEGVEKGQAVLSDKGMIGRVVEVGDKAARVLLLTDLNSRIPITFEGSHIKAVLAGDNSGVPKFLHLPHKSEIPEGAAVLTSGHGGVLPKGLLLGHIEYDELGNPAIKLMGDPKDTSFVRIVDYDIGSKLKSINN